MAAATETSVTALAIKLLVPPTGARITTNVLISPIGARTHQNRADSTDRPVPVLAKKCRFYVPLKLSDVHRQTSKVYLMSACLGR